MRPLASPRNDEKAKKAGDRIHSVPSVRPFFVGETDVSHTA